MSVSRRSLLVRSLAATGAAAVLPELGCGHVVQPAPLAPAPPPVGGKLVISVARYPDLQPIGGALAVGGYPPLLIVHPAEGTFGVFSNVCTHQGCPLGVRNGQIECPCHNSTFALDGSATRLPARRPLETFPFTYDALTDELSIDVGLGAAFPPLVGGKLVFHLSDYPQLSSPGATLLGQPDGLAFPLLLVVQQDGSVAALDPTCPHAGCEVNPAPSGSDLECPCHGSTFTTTGEVTSGPAEKNLKSFAATKDASTLTVTVA